MNILHLVRETLTEIRATRESAQAAHLEAAHACQQSAAAGASITALAEALAPSLAVAEQVAALTAAVGGLADVLGRIEANQQRLDGRAERIELYLLGTDDRYPLSQSEISPNELERRRGLLASAANGGRTP